ncbi:MAG: hypothetical protein Q7R39_16970 [Dehalococcoidia bacterium]|nr:hypothetical protein [Dehalococcoidia bacterium]
MRPGRARTTKTSVISKNEQFEKLTALSRAAIAFSSSLDLEQALSVIVQEAGRIMAFESDIILLMDEPASI